MVRVKVSESKKKSVIELKLELLGACKFEFNTTSKWEDRVESMIFLMLELVNTINMNVCHRA